MAITLSLSAEQLETLEKLRDADLVPLSDMEAREIEAILANSQLGFSGQYDPAEIMGEEDSPVFSALRQMARGYLSALSEDDSHPEAYPREYTDLCREINAEFARITSASLSAGIHRDAARMGEVPPMNLLPAALPQSQSETILSTLSAQIERVVEEWKKQMAIPLAQWRAYSEYRRSAGANYPDLVFETNFLHWAAERQDTPFPLDQIVALLQVADEHRIIGTNTSFDSSWYVRGMSGGLIALEIKGYEQDFRFLPLVSGMVLAGENSVPDRHLAFFDLIAERTEDPSQHRAWEIRIFEAELAEATHSEFSWRNHEGNYYLYQLKRLLGMSSLDQLFDFFKASSGMDRDGGAEAHLEVMTLDSHYMVVLPFRFVSYCRGLTQGVTLDFVKTELWPILERTGARGNGAEILGALMAKIKERYPRYSRAVLALNLLCDRLFGQSIEDPALRKTLRREMGHWLDEEARNWLHQRGPSESPDLIALRSAMPRALFDWPPQGEILDWVSSEGGLAEWEHLVSLDRTAFYGRAVKRGELPLSLGKLASLLVFINSAHYGTQTQALVAIRSGFLEVNGRRIPLPLEVSHLARDYLERTSVPSSPAYFPELAQLLDVPEPAAIPRLSAPHFPLAGRLIDHERLQADAEGRPQVAYAISSETLVDWLLEAVWTLYPLESEAQVWQRVLESIRDERVAVLGDTATFALQPWLREAIGARLARLQEESAPSLPSPGFVIPPADFSDTSPSALELAVAMAEIDRGSDDSFSQDAEPRAQSSSPFMTGLQILSDGEVGISMPLGLISPDNPQTHGVLALAYAENEIGSAANNSRYYSKSPFRDGWGSLRFAAASAAGCDFRREEDMTRWLEEQEEHASILDRIAHIPREARSEPEAYRALVAQFGALLSLGQGPLRIVSRNADPQLRAQSGALSISRTPLTNAASSMRVLPGR